MKTDFKIDISPSVIDDLKSRLAATRWIDQIDNDKWQYGTNKEYLKSLCSYWQNGFSWKEQEDYLNTFPHYKADVDGIGLHFIYAKGEGSHTLPLLLTHGWP
ncbi:MAG: epoxide hydrolase N-terminal domain-containing protein, partial [Williamsia sp.]|nr:epoxide hydrolase N-terminal domain-containing protein [Williamsia sp.]